MNEERIEAAANAISESSGMRFDGFWSRVEDLEPEDREYALTEASAALTAADAVMFSGENLEGLIAAIEEIVFRETEQHVFRSGWDGSFAPPAGELARAVIAALKETP